MRERERERETETETETETDRDRQTDKLRAVLVKEQPLPSPLGPAGCDIQSWV